MQDWQRKYYDDEPETRELFPLDLKRVKVIIELEVMADVSKQNTHQIVLCHPDMGGQLTFEVDNLEQAEDALDEYETIACTEEEIDPEPTIVKPQGPKSYVFPNSPVYPKYGAEPVRDTRAEPKAVPKMEPPKSDQLEQPKKQGLPITAIEENPVIEIVSDVMEIGDLLSKLSPKFKRLVDKVKKR